MFLLIQKTPLDFIVGSVIVLEDKGKSKQSQFAFRVKNCEGKPWREAGGHGKPDIQVTEKEVRTEYTAIDCKIPEPYNLSFLDRGAVYKHR